MNFHSVWSLLLGVGGGSFHRALLIQPVHKHKQKHTQVPQAPKGACCHSSSSPYSPIPSGIFSSKFWERSRSVRATSPLISPGSCSSLFSETSRQTRRRKLPSSCKEEGVRPGPESDPRGCSPAPDGPTAAARGLCTERALPPAASHAPAMSLLHPFQSRHK